MNERNAKLASLKDTLSKETSVSWAWFLAVSIFGLLMASVCVFVPWLSDDPKNAYMFYVLAFPSYAIALTLRGKQRYTGPIIDVLIEMDEDSKN